MAMMMGDLLAAARRSAAAFHSWLEHSDRALAQEAAGAARREGMSPAAFVRAAVADFSHFASEEDWATLMSSLRDSGDPGTTCLLAMVHWRLTARGCDEHAFHHGQSYRGAVDERPRSAE